MFGAQDRWWFRAYIAFSPVGALIAAAIISGIARAWPPWSCRDDLELFGVLVTLGLACYGAVIWILEVVVGTVMLAWREHKRQQKKAGKDLLRSMVESGAVDLDRISDADLRLLNIDRSDLEEMRQELLVNAPARRPLRRSRRR